MKGAIFSIGYTFTTKSFVFLVNYLAVNYLILKEYGDFSIFISTMSSLVVISSLGLLYSGNVIVSKWIEKNKSFVFNYFKISIFLIFLLSIFLSIISYILIGFYIESVLCVLFFSLTILFESFFYGLNKVDKLFYIGFINLIFSAIIIYFLINNYGLYGAILGYIFSKLILLFFQFHEFFKNFDLSVYEINKNKRKAVYLYYKKYNFPLLMSALISTPIITLVLYLLSYSKGSEEVAIYSWCYQIYLLGMFIPAALGGYYLTLLNKLKNNDKKDVMNKINLFNISITLLTILILYLFSSFILRMGNIEGIEHAKYTFYAFLVCMFFYSLNLSFMSFWVSIGKSNFYFKIQLFWAMLVLLLTWFFVKEYGSLVIPLVMSFAYFCQFLWQKYTLNHL